MVNVESLSDAELRTKLMEYGFPVMPITGTTRKLMVKKLKLLMENDNKSFSDRRSLGRYSSEEESDTDVKPATKTNRRVTMAAPSSVHAKPGVTLRKTPYRKDNVDSVEPPPSEVSKEILKTTNKRTTTTTKVFKTVSDEFDTGSDSEPEIIENDYELPTKNTNSYEYKKVLESPIRSAFTSSLFNYRSPPTRNVASPSSTTVSSNYSSFSNKPSSASRYTTHTSAINNDNDTALDRLNQIRSRLSLSTAGYDQPLYTSSPYDGKEKSETPFLSNFTRRLSQLSSPNGPKSDYDYKNDIIKEQDTNGASSYARNYLGRSRFRSGIGGRDYYSHQSKSIINDNLVSFAVLGIAVLFFVIVGVMYWGMLSNEVALGTPDYLVPHCIKTDSSAKHGINCLHEDDLEDAMALLRIIKPELVKRAITSACNGGDSTLKSYMTEPDIINFHHKLTAESMVRVQQSLVNLEILIFKNPEWGISVIQTDSTTGGGINELNEEHIVKNMEEVIELRPSKSIGLAVLHPDIPWRCTLYNKLYAIFNTLVVLVVAFFALYFCNYGYKQFKHYQQQKKDEVFNIVERIVEILQTNAGEGNDSFLVINHVRDMILPIMDRKRMERAWEEAVKFINENESRVRTEVQVVQGEPFEVWRWLGSPNLNTSSPRSKTWQGQAFETQVGSVNSLSCSPTPCLKVRGMVDDSESNFHAIREAVLSKCAHQCRILHCAVDTVSKCVYLKCADQSDAAIAYRNLHGWWYAGHLVTVKYLRLERYMQRFPDSPMNGPPYLEAVSPATDWSS